MKNKKMVETAIEIVNNEDIDYTDKIWVYAFLDIYKKYSIIKKYAELYAGDMEEEEYQRAKDFFEKENPDWPKKVK